jgi:histone H2B
MAKAARKATKKVSKKSNRKPKRSFKVFIGRVLKQTAKSKLTLSGKAAAVINSFVNHQFDAIATQAAQVARVSGEKTLSSRAIQTAVRLALPTELAKHAMAEGTKAVARASA